MATRARFVKIGNSHGIRIPRPLIEQSGLGEEVELEVDRYRIVIRRPSRSRADWRAAFLEMAERGDDGLLTTEGGGEAGGTGRGAGSAALWREWR